jgi:hypothetical protein
VLQCVVTCEKPEQVAEVLSVQSCPVIQLRLPVSVLCGLCMNTCRYRIHGSEQDGRVLLIRELTVLRYLNSWQDLFCFPLEPLYSSPIRHLGNRGWTVQGDVLRSCRMYLKSCNYNLMSCPVVVVSLRYQKIKDGPAMYV